MPAQLVNVTLWDDLQAAGGTCLGALWPWEKLSTTYRADGDDRVAGQIARASTGASLLDGGIVLRYERADASMEEWVVEVVRDVFGTDLYEVTAMPAPRLWLAERVIVRSGTDVTLSGTARLADALDTLIATDEWPAWMVAGTIDRNPTIAYSWDGANGLEALLALVTTANAANDVKLFGETMRPVFRRVSDSQYAVDLLTSATAGDPTLIEHKNLTAFAQLTERTQRVRAVLPLGASGATIAEARYLVRSLDVGQTRLELRDWSFRADRLVVAYDGQHVGRYLIAPDGDGFLITDSFAATQEVECSSITGSDFGTDDIVQIADDSGGTAFTEVALEGAANPRRVLLQGDWTAKINWARNAQWRDWSGAGGTLPRDWTNAGSGWTLSRNTDTQYIETGTDSLKIVKASGAGTATFTMNVYGFPDEFLSPGGGSQTWRAGIRYYQTVATAAITIGLTVNGGSSWSSNAAGAGAGAWNTAEVTASTTSSTTRNQLNIRIATTSTASGDFYVDRVWLFRDGTDTGDNTVEGNDPARGVYEANRLLLTASGPTTYEIGIADRYRDDPTGFPNDNLLVNQQARVIVPSRGVDVTLPIAQLDVNELAPLRTAVQLGAQRRRLTSLV